MQTKTSTVKAISHKSIISYVSRILFTFSLFTSASYATVKIPSSEAAFHIGESVIACGTVQQTKRFKRGVYLNLDKPYPHQSLTLVVWENDLSNFQKRFGSLPDIEGKGVCAQGVITQYKGKSQISLQNAFSLKLQ